MTARRWRTTPQTPRSLIAPATLAAALLLLPLLALVVRAPWRGLPRLLGTEAVRQALVLSLGSASAATGLALLLGVPLAWVLARSPLPGRGVLRALVTVPLVLPPVVGGVALLLLLGRRGLLGAPLRQATGVTVPFTPLAVVLAQTFVALPFLVLTVDGALRATDEAHEEVAATLGARGWTVFRRITLPLLAPAVGAGAALAFARALGEFGATITFAGNLPGRTQTVPVAVYLALQADPEAALALSLVLLAVAVAVLLALRGRWALRGG